MIGLLVNGEYKIKKRIGQVEKLSSRKAGQREEE
jgi:hypothetical protein